MESWGEYVYMSALLQEQIWTCWKVRTEVQDSCTSGSMIVEKNEDNEIKKESTKKTQKKIDTNERSGDKKQNSSSMTWDAKQTPACQSSLNRVLRWQAKRYGQLGDERWCWISFHISCHLHCALVIADTDAPRNHPWGDRYDAPDNSEEWEWTDACDTWQWRLLLWYLDLNRRSWLVQTSDERPVTNLYSKLGLLNEEHTWTKSFIVSMVRSGRPRQEAVVTTPIRKKC